jgi:hypothetical protein
MSMKEMATAWEGGRERESKGKLEASNRVEMTPEHSVYILIDGAKVPATSFIVVENKIERLVYMQIPRQHMQ